MVRGVSKMVTNIYISSRFIYGKMYKVTYINTISNVPCYWPQRGESRNKSPAPNSQSCVGKSCQTEQDRGRWWKDIICRNIPESCMTGSHDLQNRVLSRG